MSDPVGMMPTRCEECGRQISVPVVLRPRDCYCDEHPHMHAHIEAVPVMEAVTHVCGGAGGALRRAWRRLTGGDHPAASEPESPIEPDGAPTRQELDGRP